MDVSYTNIGYYSFDRQAGTVLLQFVDFCSRLHPHPPTHLNCPLKQDESAKLAAFILDPKLTLRE